MLFYPWGTGGSKLRKLHIRSAGRRMMDGSGEQSSGWVKVPHARIYWESTGDPDGVPVLYLHGGPGGSLGLGGYRKRHDPRRFRTIGLDQRGCGKSTPTAQDDLPHLSVNTTQTLIEDIEAVRTQLGIERWIVTGVSWGSTLALAYALQHPSRVLGIALVAVTTSSRAEIQWITEDVAASSRRSGVDSRATPVECQESALWRPTPGGWLGMTGATRTGPPWLGTGGSPRTYLWTLVGPRG